MTEINTSPLPHLGFRRFAPSVELAAYIQCYWFIQLKPCQTINSNEYLHPDGGISIIFNFSDRLGFTGQNQIADCLFDGANTTTRALQLNGHIDAMGIRFHPAGAAAFLNLPLAEVKNQLLSLDELKLDHVPLYQQLAASYNDQARIALIEQWLLEQLQPENIISKATSAALTLIKQKPSHNIKQVSQQLGITTRQLERLFNKQVGLSAKEFARNHRVKQARYYLKQHARQPLADIAYQLGFYDQAHFSHQFKQVVGISPAVYRQKSLHSNYHQPEL